MIVQNREKNLKFAFFMEFINRNYCVCSTNLTYEDFYNNLMKLNLMCLFDCNLTKDWFCRKEWILNDKINFELLKEKYGNLKHFV